MDGLVERWGPERAADLAALVDAALPGEGLTADELAAVCWHGTSTVLATADGAGAVAASVTLEGDRAIGFVKVVAVDPAARRQGIARRLLESAHDWLADHDAVEVRAGAAPPFYLWPGVDVGATPALCLFEALGYWAVGAEVNMSVDTAFRATAPEGVTVARVGDGIDAATVLGFTAGEWPTWVDECERGIAKGTCHAAVDRDGTPLGFACHSVNRAGWIGPMLTRQVRRHGGVGTALLAALCADLESAGHPTAEIAWVGPVGFYAKAADATVSRVFRSFTRYAPVRLAAAP